ncbi:MAG: DNA polymerase beta subunit [Alphaproteobacteria bacterium CG11_big_fil_rev_8_21_14_0_20_39_49]|nr:MAG: DNA polymerase beta subunit [Alphaproteobacteria bacterium CG11_big_fil_rev_8_21_14_0_20_39_49]
MHIEEQNLKLIKDILQKYVPDYEVRAYGSRVHGKNLKKFSDVDLAVITKEPIDSEAYINITDAFKESNLPYKVDVLDWSKVDESFREKILQRFEVIQVARK